MTGYFYLDVSLDTESRPEVLLPTYFKSKIDQSLQSIFGEIGGHTTVDILKFSQTDQRAILRVPSDYYVKLRAALSLISSFQEIPCCFKVNAASSVLLSLLHSSWS
ncbi:Ribonuclease P protein subunit p14 [Pseudolycoriella hygida]|uniref:Ribonuclease P protein subunit p14 n=1 Tax=Pseudolycoriella hygida TaxID=35572 RepID=A0A9Q0MJV9_9DIPT|nr:Ribonuclease P protein subunit p14 [Pseudolycoriella hygida]